MNVNRRILKIKPHYSTPNLFDIDKENMIFKVGEGNNDENVFINSDVPEYIDVICELTPIKDFSSTLNISSDYQKMVGNTESTRKLIKNIYNNNEINMNGFVSSIDIIFKDILPESGAPLVWRDPFLEDNKIYTKNFSIQKQDFKINMQEDQRYESNMFYHLISNAYPFAGRYYKGIALEDIEQYFFYIGTELQAEEYIDTVSSRKLLSNGFTQIAPGIKSSDITSLKDDVFTGKVVIKMSEEAEYQSVNIRKETIISNICILTFKRK